MTILVWFTLDLRLTDHPALHAAAKQGEVVPVYILDPGAANMARGASAWWLHHSLKSLSQRIEALGGRLILKRGDTQTELFALAKATDARAIYFSRAYEPSLGAIQMGVYEQCQQRGLECKRFAGRLLLEPDTIFNKQNKPFQVFTPFYKSARPQLGQLKALPQPRITFAAPKVASDSLDAWHLCPRSPNWAKGFRALWHPGESGADEVLTDALQEVVPHYAQVRDFPARAGTSMLSPHLHFGELSPRQIWVRTQKTAANPAALAEPFLRQLFWREFNAYLLHHFPHVEQHPFNAKFKAFPWRKNTHRLRAWQTGQTGYPIVDAGMRELWQTGWMHNRVRMVVASFLTKHLNIHWREGADWFWETLLDADLANNSLGWQWVAGCGADAAPYYRIFNPVTQGERFDANGEYVRRWVPELAKLDNKNLHNPWLASKTVLAEAGIVLGKDYPKPVVDHAKARAEALFAYRTLTEGAG